MTDMTYFQYSMSPQSPSSPPLDDSNMNKTQRIAHQWNYWFAKLLEFYRKHGHCNVKQGNSPERQLGGWLARQRFLYREGNLSQVRAKKLKDMGVDFAIQRTPATIGSGTTKPQKRTTPDDDFFDDTTATKKRDNTYYYGDDSDYADSSSEVEIMDEDYYPTDSTWGAAQRRESLHQTPQPAPKFPVHAPQIWEERYQQLRLYKDIYGHCMVPARFPENRSLGYWVKHIRSYYNEGRLPEDWIVRLNTLGFVWRVKGTHLNNRTSSMKQSPSQSSSDSDDSEDYLAAEQLALLSELSASRDSRLFVLV
jgi:hypothetical protein